MKNKFFLIFSLLFLTFFFMQEFMIEKTYSLFKVEKNVSGTISVPERNFCLSHGFNKLSDCMLVMENYSTSVSAAKTFISNKGKATYTEIAPNNVYVRKTEEKVANEGNYLVRTASHYTLATDVQFNSTTGKYVLGGYKDGVFDESLVVNDVLSDKYINYYTCGSTEGTSRDCARAIQIRDYKVTVIDATTYYDITKATMHTPHVSESFDAEVGLYKETDSQGTTYFYRGNVQNNYVSYAGYIWKIIRRNGDGSVRMIYNGNSTSSTGTASSIASSNYSDKPSDPIYVGYMFNENFALSTNGNTSVTFVRFSENTEYYFADNYMFDENTKKFKLSGNMIYGTWGAKYNDVISKYKYTCFGSSKTDTCDFIANPVTYTNDYTMKIKVISYSSVDATSILTPKTSSTIKTVVDTWYENNILNKKDSKSQLLSNYLSDNIFCNDRTLTSGNGYTLSKSSYYAPNNRVSNATPLLTCSQSVDKFTVGTSLGNGALKYPIGLVTADELIIAGGNKDIVNTKYYLYTSAGYWSMSPSFFGGSYVYARPISINSSGEIGLTYSASKTLGVRPVINLKSTVIIDSGDGSREKPYVVSLG